MIVEDITIEEYLSNNDYLSSSKLGRLRYSPSHFYYALTHQERATDSQIIGSAIHMALSEPELFEEKYVCWKDEMKPHPDKDYKNRENLRAKGEFFIQAREKGFEVLTEDQYNIIHGIKGKITNDPTIKQLFKSGFYERSFFWTDEKSGIKLKTRPDFYPGSAKFVADFKTTVSAQKTDFTKSCYEYGYPVQAVMQRKAITLHAGKEPSVYLYIAIEKEPPYEFNIIEADKTYIQYGEYLFEEYLKVVKWCRENNRYPGYQFWVHEDRRGIEIMESPMYMHTKVTDGSLIIPPNHFLNEE